VVLVGKSLQQGNTEEADLESIATILVVKRNERGIKGGRIGNER